MKKQIKSKTQRKNSIDLLKMKNIQELYHLITILDEKEQQRIIDNFKNHLGENLDSLPSPVRENLARSSTKEDFIHKLKEELIKDLEKEYKLVAKEVKKKKKSALTHLNLMKFHSRLKLFSLTLDKKDFYAIKKILHQASISNY